MVAGAKGYKIYRSSSLNGRYIKVKTINGRSTTAWTDKKVKTGKRYYYRVAAFNKNSGEFTYTSKSYWVANKVDSVKIVKVKIDKSSIQAIVGQTIKVKASVKAKSTTKKLLSKKVRWYSSNTAIAKVNNSGEVTGVKVGKCYVWAKAYNGNNSKKIQVVVK